MKSIHTIYPRFVGWLIVCATVGFGGIPTANAFHDSFPGNVFIPLCGSTARSPLFYHDGTGGHAWIAPSVITAVLRPTASGLSQVRQTATLKHVLPDSSVEWTRALTITSLADAQSTFPGPPFEDSFFWANSLNLNDRATHPTFQFGFSCLALGVASARGQRRIVAGLGNTAQTGGSLPPPSQTESLNSSKSPVSGIEAVVSGKDRSLLNFWTINPNTGGIIRKISIRGKPGRYIQIFSSGYWDADDDGDTELIIAYVKFIGLIRYDFVFEHYDIITGALERTTTTSQFNQVKVLK